MLFDNLISQHIIIKNIYIAVAQAADPEILDMIHMVSQKNMAQFILFGDKEKTNTLLQSYDSNMAIVDSIHSDNPSMDAAKAVANGMAQILLKGNVGTAELLSAVFHCNLKTETLVSHVGVFELEHYKKPLLITDAAINIAPNVDDKLSIVRNAVHFAQNLGITCPKVAMLSAIELMNTKISSTVEAAAICVAGQRGQLGNCIVDGPLALDNALSKEAAEHKGIDSEVAGNADIIVASSIESGNTLYKSLIYCAKAQSGSVVMGTQVPIILTSRSDSAQTKINSIILAITLQINKNNNNAIVKE